MGAWVGLAARGSAALPAMAMARRKMRGSRRDCRRLEPGNRHRQQDGRRRDKAAGEREGLADGTIVGIVSIQRRPVWRMALRGRDENIRALMVDMRMNYEGL